VAPRNARIPITKIAGGGAVVIDEIAGTVAKARGPSVADAVVEDRR
jgi:hypothetical protein